MADQPRAKRDLSPEEKAVRTWILSKRRILRDIAENAKPPASEQFVQQLAYNRSPRTRKDHRVYRLLKDAGWPGMPAKSTLGTNFGANRA